MVKRNLLRLFLIYILGTALVLVFYYGLGSLTYRFLPRSLQLSPALIQFGLILLTALLLLALRALFTVLPLAAILPHRKGPGEILPEVRDAIEQQIDAVELSKTFLQIFHDLFAVDDCQLTFYYDLPVGIEVTHVRLREGAYTLSVQRAHEDDAPKTRDDHRFLSPQESSISEILTHRDRLVGLLLCGPSRNGIPLTHRDHETLRLLLPLIAGAVDQVLLIRRVSEANQRLFENEKLISIGQLASGIAHEIRNPLSSLKINLQGLSRMEALGERDLKRITICLDEIKRLDEIVNEVMQFARRTNLEVDSTIAKDLIDRALELARAELETHGSKVVVEIGEDLPVIQADRNRLVRVLLNLILNGIQAMEPGGILELRAERYGEGLEIQVRDHGEGVPKELQRDIFNPFFTTKAKGTGLGLANALKTIQEHGGELDLSSVEGKGAVFSVRLPSSPPVLPDDPSSLRVLPK